jgi:membrane protease YdiL (CAAX protease family)
MVIIPILLFTIFGGNNDQNLNRHYYGFIVGTSLTLYAVFEECGWRGFLQNEFANLKPFLRAILIGSFWYLWHLSFISNDTTVLDELKFFGILVFASWGIGAIADKTKSIFASACFHLIGSILTFSPLISNSFDNQTRYIIFGICLFSWIIIVNTWEKSIITQK